MIKLNGFTMLFLLSIILKSCAGTTNTISYSKEKNIKYNKAYIISSENSKYIKFKFGTFTYLGYTSYTSPKDDPSIKSEIIGNTDTIIKHELEKYGIYAEIGKKGDIPENFDLIVKYNDTWRWDFKKILDELEIIFISPQGDSVIAKSTFKIYKNKELHNFPNPEKEVPKMIKQLLNE